MIIVPAEQLTIRGIRRAASAPRRDVIGLYRLKFKVVVTDRADSDLPLVGLTLLVRPERPDAQALFDFLESVSAFLVRDILVGHQARYIRSQLLRVEIHSTRFCSQPQWRR